MASAVRRSVIVDVRSPSAMIDGRIAELGDWRGETLAQVRALIRQVVPDVVEGWKWRPYIRQHISRPIRLICSASLYVSPVNGL